MTLAKCIDRAVASGRMDKRRGDAAKALFDDNVRQAKLGLGDAEALARAREETVKEVRYALAKNRREKLLQVSRTRDLLTAARASGQPIDRALMAVMDYDPGLRGVPNLTMRKNTIRGVLHGGMVRYLERFRRNLLGENRNKAELLQVGKEIFGETTGNINARQMAEAWKETAERARKMFNAAGGDIPRLDSWGIPHSHDAIAVRAAGFDKWFAAISKAVDPARMVDYETGKAMTAERFQLAAREAFEAIATEGWSRREANGTAFGQKLSRRHTDHRFFTFKDFDSWHEYHQTYGEGDIFSVMMGHLDGMARDIAALQILGPNPSSMIRLFGDVIEKDLADEALRTGAKTDALASRARSSRRNIEQLWEHYTGAVSAPINGRLARTFAGVRSFIQSAQLGSAALSAVGDLGFQNMAAGQVGIPMNRILTRIVKLLNPADTADQQLAVRLGLIAENWSSLAMAQQRYLGEVTGPEITRRLADFTMRISGLSPWTQAGRWSFGMEFAGLLAEHSNKRLADLPTPLRKTLEGYQISDHEWEVARATPMLEHGGARFLRPEDVPEEAIAHKLAEMIHAETEFAVPSASPRGRLLLVGDSRPGTVSGELMRSVAMYKNFAATLLFTHMRRSMNMPTAGEKGKYIAQLIITSAVMGALALQLKQIATGKDPRQMVNMEDPAQSAKFWGAAIMQGGGLGIFGDFLFAQQNRFGGGLAETVAGPVVGAAADFTGYFNENLGKMAAGKDSNWAGGAIDITSRYMPGGSIWWSRQAMEHLIWDQLRGLADPTASDRFARMEKTARRDYGQDYWYQPGEALPARAPNIAAAFGG